ncbi:MAG: hypothetical protein K9J13_03180 [Saprospiraceae bacterium]|nr:hypothetical protein [Saprospiraceae bacterium]
MRKYIVLIIATLFLFSCSGTKDLHSYQKKYIPKEFHNLYLGMPLKEIKKVIEFSEEDISKVMSFRLSIVEENKTEQIKEVTYYLDDGEDNPLYEIIIEYNDIAVRDNVVKKLYGEPNHGEEWRFETQEFPIMVWTYQSKLIIAAKMKGTEWENEE